MSDELKPCPFCGSAMQIYEDVVDASPSWFTANCTSTTCRCVSWGGTDYDAVVARANRRPVEDALCAELVELRAKWASVPWDDINVALFEVFHDGDCHCDHCSRLKKAIATAEDWYDANKPKEPTE